MSSPATDTQVQSFVDKFLRPYSDKLCQLLALGQQIVSEIDDVYTAAAEQSPTWSDSRNDGPPHLATPSDVLAMNTLIRDINTAISGDAQFSIAQKLRVN